MRWFACAWGEGCLKSIPGSIESMLDVMDFKSSTITRDTYACNDVAFMLASNDHQLYNKTKIKKTDRYIMVGDIMLHNQKEMMQKYGIGNDSLFEVEELVIYLYHNHGRDFVKFIIGEFSFVIWDTEKKSLFAARDHLGMKTLFWLHHKNTYWLASDISVLRKLLNYERLNFPYFLVRIGFNS